MKKNTPKPRPAKGSPKLLSASQRSTLSAIASEAFMHLAPGLDETSDDFRKSQSRIATQKLDLEHGRGWRISEAPASAFDAIFDHFKMLKGQGEEVFDRQVDGVSSTMRNHLHHITVAERAARVPHAYTQAICRNMFRTSEPKDEKQALALLSALQKKARKGAAA